MARREVVAPIEHELVERVLSLPPAAMAFAVYHSSRSPYPLSYWMRQAWARKGFGDSAWPIDRERDAHVDARIKEMRAREAKQAAKRKGKK